MTMYFLTFVLSCLCITNICGQELIDDELNDEGYVEAYEAALHPGNSLNALVVMGSSVQYWAMFANNYRHSLIVYRDENCAEKSGFRDLLSGLTDDESAEVQLEEVLESNLKEVNITAKKRYGTFSVTAEVKGEEWLSHRISRGGSLSNPFELVKERGLYELKYSRLRSVLRSRFDLILTADLDYDYGLAGSHANPGTWPMPVGMMSGKGKFKELLSLISLYSTVRQDYHYILTVSKKGDPRLHLARRALVAESLNDYRMVQSWFPSSIDLTRYNESYQPFRSQFPIAVQFFMRDKEEYLSIMKEVKLMDMLFKNQDDGFVEFESEVVIAMLYKFGNKELSAMLDAEMAKFKGDQLEALKEEVDEFMNLMDMKQ